MIFDNKGNVFNTVGNATFRVGDGQGDTLVSNGNAYFGSGGASVRSGNTLFTSGGAVTQSGNAFFGSGKTYTRSGSTLFCSDGTVWNGITSDEDVRRVILMHG